MKETSNFKFHPDCPSELATLFESKLGTSVRVYYENDVITEGRVEKDFDVEGPVLIDETERGGKPIAVKHTVQPRFISKVEDLESNESIYDSSS